MKRRTVCGLFGALLLTSAVAAPQASAADCTYTARELPFPAGARDVGTSGTSPDNNLIIGWASGPLSSGWKDRGVVWRDGVMSQMADPPDQTDYTNVSARDINNSGTIAGTVSEFASDWRAVRYENGTYEYLYTEEHENSSARGINEAGDIIGEVALKEDTDDRWMALWPKDGPRRLYAKGRAVDVTDDRKLLMYTDNDAWVIDGTNGQWTQIRGAAGLFTFDNERILRHERIDDVSQLREWSLDGESVATYAGGSIAYGKNSAGTLLGRTYEGVTSLWQGGTRSEVVANERFRYFTDITDDGVLIGVRVGQGGFDRPALWSCS